MRVGVEPTNDGFADRPLNHLGTAPKTLIQLLDRKNATQNVLYNTKLIIYFQIYSLHYDNSIPLLRQPS